MFGAPQPAGGMASIKQRAEEDSRTAAGSSSAAAHPPASRPVVKGWAYEGIACYVLPAAVGSNQSVVPLYRAWNGSDHFYTSVQSEYEGLPRTYDREGVACYVYSTSAVDRVPLYRFYNGSADDHLYTISEAERRNLNQDRAWNEEGIQCYVSASPRVDHIPLYRAYNAGIADHFYTTSDVELDNAAPTLDRAALEALLRNDLAQYLSGDARMFMADSSYFCATKPAAEQVIAAAHVDSKIWTAEVYDCDDFAHQLKSAFINDQYTDRGVRTRPYAMGIAWGSTSAGGHAMNVIVVAEAGDWRVYIIEPQTSTFYLPGQNKLYDIYFMVF